MNLDVKRVLKDRIGKSCSYSYKNYFFDIKSRRRFYRLIFGRTADPTFHDNSILQTVFYTRRINVFFFGYISVFYEGSCAS